MDKEWLPGTKVVSGGAKVGACHAASRFTASTNIWYTKYTSTTISYNPPSRE